MITLRAIEMTRRTLKELSRLTGLPMYVVLDQAVSAYHRTMFLEKLNEDFAALRVNPQAWHEEQDERAIWEQSISDHLPREESIY